MSAALGLMRLQKVDTKIDQLEAELERVNTELANDEALRAAQTGFDEAAEALAKAESGRSDAEAQTKAVRSKMQQAEASLYAGSIHNPKELQDLQADVASLKKHLTKLEESELRWMEQAETAESSMQVARENLAKVQGDSRASTGRLSEKRGELLQGREDLRSEREAAAAALPPAQLATYEKLRKARRGVAVAAIKDGACSACGTTLTAALQQSARHAPDAVNCPSCGRILFGD